VEVVVALFLATLIILGIYHTFTLGSDLTYSAAQRVAAFNLCRERIEQMRGMPFDVLISTNFPPEQLSLTHLGGSACAVIDCMRSCSLSVTSNPTRAEVEVAVQWEFRERPMEESAFGVIYERN
jgi:hypothetical protein